VVNKTAVAWTELERVGAWCLAPPWTEQVEMVVLRLTADEVVMMAADWRSGEE
jgi:hypothetical protein